MAKELKAINKELVNLLSANKTIEDKEDKLKKAYSTIETLNVKNEILKKTLTLTQKERVRVVLYYKKRIKSLEAQIKRTQLDSLQTNIKKENKRTYNEI